MAKKTITLSKHHRNLLRHLAAFSQEPETVVLERAADNYYRYIFLARVNEGYARLRQDPAAWSEMQRELGAWEATLGDGLDEDDILV